MSPSIVNLVSERIAPQLKLRGWRRVRTTFHVKTDYFSKILVVEGSPHNRKAASRFTVTLGVYFPEVQDLLDGYWGKRVTGVPQYANCHIVARIGELMPRKSDKWWNIGHRTEDAVVADVSTAITKHALPWIDGINDYSTAVDHNFTSSIYASVALKLLAGNRREAEEQLQTRIDGTIEMMRNGADANRAWTELKSIIEWSDRCGIPTALPAAGVMPAG